MTTTVSISLTTIDEPARRNLPHGIVHIGEAVRLVLASRGLSLVDEPNAERPAPATGANDLF